MRLLRVCLRIALGACLLSQAVAGTKDGDRVRFSVTTGARYTDNRDAASDGLEDDNIDLYIRPRVDLVFEGERSFVDLYYTPAYRYRSDPGINQDDHELLHDVGVTGVMRFSRRFHVRGQERFAFTDDPAVSEDASTVRASQTFYMNRAGVGVDLMVLRQTQISVDGRHYIKRYKDDVVATRSDEDRMDVEGRLKQHLDRTLRCGVMARYSAYGYDNDEGFERGFDALTGAVVVEKDFSKYLQAGINAGAQMATYDDSSLEDSTSPFGELWVRGRTAPSFRMEGVVGHAVRDADAYPFSSQEYSEIRGRVDWDASPFVTLSVGGGYRDSEYTDVLPAAVPLAALIGLTEGSETRLDAYAQLALNLSETTGIKLRQRFEDVDSDVSRSYAKNTTVLELVQRF